MNPNPTEKSPDVIPKTEIAQILEPISKFTEKNPQIVDNKLHYVVSGSTAVILFAESEEIKIYTIDDKGNLTEVETADVGNKSQTFIKENISQFGKPSDIDISVTKNNATEDTMVEDQFVLRAGEKVLRGTIDGKEYYFEQPLDYIAKLLANRYGGMSHEHSKAYGKLRKMEMMIEGVTQDISVEALAVEIEKRLETPDMQLLNYPESLQRRSAESFLSNPLSMYSWLSKTILRDNDGQREASVNINQFPRVKEIIDTLSSRHINNTHS